MARGEGRSFEEGDYLREAINQGTAIIRRNTVSTLSFAYVQEPEETSACGYMFDIGAK